MRTILIIGLLAAGTTLMLSQALVQGAGRGGTVGGSIRGTTGGGATGTTGTNPGLSAIPVPQTPPPGQFNPGVKPNAPGPSGITPSPGSSSGMTGAQGPGFAGSGGAPPGHRQPRAEDLPQNKDSGDDAMKKLDQEIDSKLSIWRGC
jgi:hypothetical protein